MSATSNPFENPEGKYHVLINEEGQHSLWPTFVQVPQGWRVIVDAQDRAACMAYINEHWTDMRPTSLDQAASAALSAVR